jgi:hypothetical protein
MDAVKELREMDVMLWRGMDVVVEHKEMKGRVILTTAFGPTVFYHSPKRDALSRV